MLEELKESVHRANLELVERGLVFETFGNVSGLDRSAGVMVIKPSGVPYGQMKARDMVAVCLERGKVIEGEMNPSSDTPTHLELYRAFDCIGGVVHSHSLHAAAWAQAGRDIPALGTTHADYFHGPVPCTRRPTDEEIAADYEANTGRLIVERLAGIDPRHCPGVLVGAHGPFAWGTTPTQAVLNAAILEHVARLASETLRIDPAAGPIPQPLLDKHFLRKHGPDSYYGQPGGKG
jgi:L-ribulose-5-phosphate 4-epimerase